MVRAAILLFLALISLDAQTLPTFAAETLSGRKVSMPALTSGHMSLLVIGFTHASGTPCTEWAKRLETEFKTSSILERYSVIFLEDAPKLVRGMAIHGIKSGVPKENYDHFLIVTEHEKEVKAAVHFQTPDDPYLVLLGPDGAIRWTSHGAVSDALIRQIQALLQP